MSHSAYPGPAYKIVTPRLVIRCWDPPDSELLKEAIDSSLEHLRPWMPWANDEPTDLETKVARLRSFRGNFDLDKDYVYGIFNRAEDRVLGGTGLHTRLGEGALEIGYWVRADAINQGIASEASAALTRAAFEIHKVNRVEIHCDPANVRSAAVPRKLEYTHEATLRQRLPLDDGGWRDTMIWTMLAEDYPNSPSTHINIQCYDAIGRELIP